jgi:hypothetical protein
MQVWQDVINWADEYLGINIFQSAGVLPIPHLHKYLYVSGNPTYSAELTSKANIWTKKGRKCLFSKNPN